MQIILPLEKMTVEEKLKVMEEIWSNLIETERNIKAPSWHKDILQERENSTREFVDWEEEKNLIRNKLE